MAIEGDGVDMIAGDVEYDDVASEDWSIKDEAARDYVETATSTVASLVRSTLGPSGMEKLIATQDPQGRPEIVQTTDAEQILAAIERGDGFNHPVAALFIDAIDSMQRGLGDGTTTAMILTAELIERGVDLAEEGVHPGTIIVGYAMALNRAGEVLDALATSIAGEDHDRIATVAATTMTADLDPAVRAEYAEAVADAIERLADHTNSGFLDTDTVKVLAGRGEGTGLREGLVVRRFPTALEESEESVSEFDWSFDFPEPTEDVRLVMVEREIDFEESATSFGGEGWDTGVLLDTADRVESYRTGLEDRVAQTAASLKAHDVDAIVSQERVKDTIKQLFEREGLVVLDNVTYPKADIHRLATDTGGAVLGHLDEVDDDAVGVANTVYERRVGDEKWTFFVGSDGPASTIILDNPLETDSDRHVRIVEDAVETASMAVMDGQVLPGAGAPAMAVASALRDYATTVPDREQLAIEAFAEAVEQIPYVLVENAGLDPVETLIRLRNAHADGTAEEPRSLGVNLSSGEPMDSVDADVLEPRRVFSQALETAYAATEQLLTVDAVLFPGVDFDHWEPALERE